MCGLLFAKRLYGLDLPKFKMALDRQKWRGPDNQQVEQISSDMFLGHARLAIIDPDPRSSQPFISNNGAYKILFNGEIYNHLEIRRDLGLACRTQSDTETILEGFIAIGCRIFERLEGMFAIVVVYLTTGDFWIARDRFGIKPLFEYATGESFVYSSECISIRELTDCTIDPLSVDEWRLIRRPMRGHSFFKEITEVLPGSILHNGTFLKRLPTCQVTDEPYNFSRLTELLKSSVIEHELSDVENVALLSGGIDSSLITAFSQCREVYSVGTPSNNEFSAAKETAASLGRRLRIVCIDNHGVQETWRRLIQLKGEPLSVPNEALIYSVCSQMEPNQKVVLTGEGADEVFFGYDRIFRWASQETQLNLNVFLHHYGYGDTSYLTERLNNDLEQMLQEKPPIEFVEDFFFHYHLPALLRRMDFASMAASKEARVPFVYRTIVDYMYRRPLALRISATESKLPLRRLLAELHLESVTNRKKIGFSATLSKDDSRRSEYEKFQNYNLGVLGW